MSLFGDDCKPTFRWRANTPTNVKPVSSIPSLLKCVMNLFDLLKEIVIGGETGDLSFMMEGIACLKT
jgi:hypothetical protein